MNSSSYKFGLLGCNIDYSRSPAIFRAIHEVTGLDIEFKLYDTAPDGLAQFMGSLVAQGVTGLSVTVPYKEAVIPYLKRHGEVADRVRAVNSIHLSQGELVGYNTDWHGIAYSLAPYREQIENGEALLIGTGGAARAAAYAVCADLRVKRITVAGRNPAGIDRTRQLCESLGVQTRMIGEVKQDEVDKYAIVLNCTPVGGSQDPTGRPLPGTIAWSQIGLYFDVNYNKDNRNIRDAMAHDVLAVSGSKMLVAQAAKSLQLWTGRAIVIEQIHDMVFGA